MQTRDKFYEKNLHWIDNDLYLVFKKKGTVRTGK